MTLESLLSAAPPGQLDGLVKDLSMITSVSTDLVETIRQSSSSEMTIIPDSSNSSSSSNNDARAQHLDALVDALKQEFKTYQEKYYTNIDYAVSVEVQQQQNSHSTESATAGVSLVIQTCAKRIDAHNHYAGSWNGKWTMDTNMIRVGDTDGSAKLVGSMHIHVYCHEDCNIHMEITKSYPDNTLQVHGDNKNKDNNTGGGGGVNPIAALAHAIQSKIETFESDVVVDIQELYDTMDDKLKALRRVLPIMRTRLQWNVLAHRMVKKLEESTTTATPSH